MNASDRKHLEEAFSRYLPRPANLDPHLRLALDRVLQNPGSLVRPEIVFQMSRAYEIGEDHGTELAIALEYFHTASLLFDDLPCMDDAIERRGTPCVHLEFGEAGAILAALALINRAYSLAWSAVSDCPRDCQSRALAYIEQHLGIGGLLNGQSMDLNYSNLRHDRHTTQQIAVGKTVSLIRLALVLPALLGGAAASELSMLERIAMCWGLSYQIVDDLKDVLQNSAESGKTGARDISLGRPNIAIASGVPYAVARLTRLIRLGDRMLRRLTAARPALLFLEKLRAEMGEEAMYVMRNARDEKFRVPA